MANIVFVHESVNKIICIYIYLCVQAAMCTNKRYIF